jgi:hypothetical protein
MDEKYFRAYITQIIEFTFGFTPSVSIIFPSEKNVQVTVDGTQLQRAAMMGKQSQHYQSLKLLLRVFAKRNGYFSDFYIKPSLDEYGNPKTLAGGYIEG